MVVIASYTSHAPAIRLGKMSSSSSPSSSSVPLEDALYQQAR